MQQRFCYFTKTYTAPDNVVLTPAPKDKDVLVKVLLNEVEATLPIPTDCAPYYHWADFRQFCLTKLAAYKR